MIKGNNNVFFDNYVLYKYCGRVTRTMLTHKNDGNCRQQQSKQRR